MNIAEGSGRPTRADYSRFLGYASGSCNEAEYQILLARDLGYLSTDDHETMTVELSELRAMLTSLQQALSAAADEP